MTKIKPSRDPEFRKYIRQQSCVLQGQGCKGRIEAAHFPPYGEGRMGSKSSDYFCAPLCTLHHRLSHEGKLEPEETTAIHLSSRRFLVKWLDTKRSAA